MTAGSRSPGSSQYPQPIFEAQFFDQTFAKPAAAQQSHDRLQLGGTSQAGRHFCAVEIGAEADAVLADMFQNMVDVFQDQVGGRIRVAMSGTTLVRIGSAPHTLQHGRQSSNITPISLTLPFARLELSSDR